MTSLQAKPKQQSRKRKIVLTTTVCLLKGMNQVRKDGLNFCVVSSLRQLASAQNKERKLFKGGEQIDRTTQKLHKSKLVTFPAANQHWLAAAKITSSSDLGATMNFIIDMTAKSLRFKPITRKCYKKEQYNVNYTAGTKWSLHAGEKKIWKS